MWYFFPLVISILVAGILVLSMFHHRTRMMVTRIALAIFGKYVAAADAAAHRKRDQLRAAHTGQNYRVFASLTYLYSAVLGVIGSVMGVYLLGYLLSGLQLDEAALYEMLPDALTFLAPLAQLSEITVQELFVLLLVSSATTGTVLAVGMFYLRWELINQRTKIRARNIDATLPRTVAFIYAMSRSGMALPVILYTLAQNEDVFGEAARELSVGVREMRTFQTDALTALRETAKRTPSDNLSEFTENLASVLSSGQDLPAFLRSQYQRFQDEAKAQQEQYLELLSTFAEAYVTTLVAGPLFLITILIVVGLVLSDTLTALRVVIYLGIPLGSLLFAFYVDSATESIRAPKGIDRSGSRQTTYASQQPAPSARTVDSPGLHTDAEPVSDGGAATGESELGDIGNGTPAGRESPSGGSATVNTAYPGSETAQSIPSDHRLESLQLATYDRFNRFYTRLSNPIETIYRLPSATFILTLPIGLLWVFFTAESTSSWDPVTVASAIDGPIVEAVIFSLLVYAVFFELNARRLRVLEESVPDFLDRFASVNEAGMSVVRSLERIADSELDKLTDEIQRTWRDIEWGADVESALYRLEERTYSPMISRSVALIANAIHASGDVAPVLSIAAEEARATRRLRRERQQVMLTYLIVIYISFLVFLGIVVALTVAFIPAVEQAQLQTDLPAGTAGPGTGFVGTIGNVDIGAFEQVLFHATMIQAFISGIISGQLGEGTIQNGVKHAVILLTLGYLTFVFMLF